MCSQCSLQSWGFWHPLYWVSTPIGNHKAIGTTCITGYKVTAYEVRYYDITLSKFSTSNRCCVTSLYKKIKQFCKSVVLKKYIYKNYPGVPFFCNVNLWTHTHTQKRKRCKDLLGALVSINPSPPKYWAWDLWWSCGNSNSEWSSAYLQKCPKIWMGFKPQKLLLF